MLEKLSLKSLSAELEALKSTVALLEDKLKETPANETPVAEVKAPEAPDPNFPKYPTPPDFIAVVDEVLNKNFGIECDPLPDSPMFDFKIIVPEKYSNTPPEKRVGRDVRSKVISYSEGAVGVRLWAEKVLENLGEEIKFRITEDRPFANRAI